MALLIRPGASAADILAQIYEAGLAADLGQNFDFGGRGYRVTTDTLREAMQIYNEHFPDEGMGQRVRRRFQDMMGGVVPAGGRLGRHGLQAARIGGRAAGAGIVGIGQGAAHIGAAAAAGDHTPAVVALAGAGIAAQGAGMAAGALSAAGAAVAAAADSGVWHRSPGRGGHRGDWTRVARGSSTVRRVAKEADCPGGNRTRSRTSRASSSCAC